MADVKGEDRSGAASEREVPLGVALRNVRTAAAMLGGALDVEYLRRGPYPVTRCRFRQGGRPASEGAGKGYGQQAEASATFEAIEHYFLRTSNQKQGDFRLVPVREVVAQRAMRADQLVHQLGQSVPFGRVACAPYQSLNGEPGIVWVPLFFVDPTYSLSPMAGDDLPYRNFGRYGTGTGSAAGSTFDEAVLHGLLETVERDSLARFFLSRFKLGVHAEQCLVDDSLISAPLMDALRELVGRTRRTMRLFDLRTEISIPVYMAESRGPGAPFGVFGCGCSHDSAYAVERAVTELIQMETEGSWEDVDSNFRRAATEQPDLWRLIAPLESMENVTFGRSLDHERSMRTVKESLASVAFAVGRVGLSPLYRITSTQDLPVTTVSVYVAGAERFYLSRWGHVVEPTGLDYRMQGSSFRGSKTSSIVAPSVDHT